MSRTGEEQDTGFRIGARGSDTEGWTTRLETRTWRPRASPCRDLRAAGFVHRRSHGRRRQREKLGGRARERAVSFRE